MVIGAGSKSGRQLKVSPSRTYVAMCNKTNFDGYYFKKFTLPSDESFKGTELESVVRNETGFASWYFLNVLDSLSCLEECIPWEDYTNLQEVEPGRGDWLTSPMNLMK